MKNSSIIPPPPVFENRRHIYFVAAHKLILNVSKIRLRLICARASYLYRLFSKDDLLQYTAPLRCRFTKNSPRRIRSGTDAAGSKLQQVFRQKNLSLYSVHGRTLYNMPAGIFCALLVSASPISKRHFSTAMDGGCSMQQRRRQQMYRDVHLLTRYLYRLFSKVFSHYTAHLLRYCAQINPHRIKISINGCKNINSG